MAWSRVARESGEGALAGLKVLSFGAFVAGNTCALMLAEFGADVVKLESRRRPEALRAYYSPDDGDAFEPSGVQTTALFAGYARSTRSLCINMDSEDGRQLFRRLATEADIVIENLGPGQMERWGCDYETLRAINPRIILTSISGYGRTGPRSTYRAYASNIGNYLGLTKAWAHDGVHFDYIAGYQAVSAILGALQTVELTGAGMYLDVAQSESGAAVMAPLYLDSLNGGPDWQTEHNHVPGAVLSEVLRCRNEDEWVAVELEDTQDWNTMCAVLERPDLSRLSDDEIDEYPVEELQAALEKWAANQTSFQVAVKLQKVGLAAAPVTNTEDLWRDPQLRSRNAFHEIEHPDLGSIEYPGSPERLDLTPARVVRPGPRLGEHSEEVVAGWLGLGQAEIAELRATDAFWQMEVPAGE